jgi:hypothetical protein
VGTDVLCALKVDDIHECSTEQPDDDEGERKAQQNTEEDAGAHSAEPAVCRVQLVPHRYI